MSKNGCLDDVYFLFLASSVQQEPVQFNTPEPFKQDEMLATGNSIEEKKSEEIFQTSNNKLSEIKSTLWQSLNDRTTTTDTLSLLPN